MGNAAAGGMEQEQAEGREARNSVGASSTMSDPVPALQKKQPAPPKLPMPPEEELEERFNVVLVSDCSGPERAHTLHRTQRAYTRFISCATQCQLGNHCICRSFENYEGAYDENTSYQIHKLTVYRKHKIFPHPSLHSVAGLSC